MARDLQGVLPLRIVFEAGADNQGIVRMGHSAGKVIYLETSSYLPLLWRTPYSQSVIRLMKTYAADHEFVLQQDCVLEGAGYLSFEDNWKYHPAVRIRAILGRMGDEELDKLAFPSSAVQLLLGGNIWPQAQYLNYVRHTAFFFVDLLDGISWKEPRKALGLLAEQVDERISAFRQLFQHHSHPSELMLPGEDILPYWGQWYLSMPTHRFKVKVISDPRPFNMTTHKLRDLYHYDCAVNGTPTPSMMLVANTGFKRNIKSSFAALPCPIVCARTCSSEVYAEE